MNNYTLEKIISVTKDRKPDWNNILSVLKKETPKRPTLFEFFLNDPLERKIAMWEDEFKNEDEKLICKIKAFRNAGYDYVTMHPSNFYFEHGGGNHGKSSLSANEGAMIFDRESFDRYKWQDPRDFYDGRLERLEKHLPDGMKFIVFSPGGVLENTINLLGFDNLCYLLLDDPELVELVVDNIGQRILNFYAQVVNLDCVGAIVSNDDWGFNTQTMLSTADMRKYIFKWHRKIAQLAHDAGKPVILHSCGNLSTVFDDIINDMKFDGKHSYEDNIVPVEKMYDVYSGKLAVLGGIDMDYVCRSSQEDIYNRAKNMLTKTGCKGYALGTGNSIPTYLPDENYFAMISAALY